MVRIAAPCSAYRSAASRSSSIDVLSALRAAGLLKFEDGNGLAFNIDGHVVQSWACHSETGRSSGGLCFSNILYKLEILYQIVLPH